MELSLIRRAANGGKEPTADPSGIRCARSHKFHRCNPAKIVAKTWREKPPLRQAAAMRQGRMSIVRDEAVMSHTRKLIRLANLLSIILIIVTAVDERILIHSATVRLGGLDQSKRPSGKMVNRNPHQCPPPGPCNLVLEIRLIVRRLFHLQQAV